MPKNKNNKNSGGGRYAGDTPKAKVTPKNSIPSSANNIGGKGNSTSEGMKGPKRNFM